MSVATQIFRLQKAKADLKTAIRNKGVTVDDSALISSYAGLVDSIPSGGSQEEKDKSFLWNRLFDANIPAVKFPTGTTEIVVYFPDNATNLVRTTLRQNESLTLDKIKIISGNATPLSLAQFRYSIKVKEIDLTECDTSKITNYSYAFAFLNTSGLLTTITGEIDFSSLTAGADTCFVNCSVLKELRIKPESIKANNFSFGSCSSLSSESIDSIINGLAYLEEGQTATLTLHATVKGKITTEQDALIKSKGWTY